MTVYNWGEDPNGLWKLIFTDNNQVDSFKKHTRDLEAEYMEELDKQKKARRQKSVKRNQESEEENVVNAQEDVYKREAYENAAYDILKRAYEGRDDDRYDEYNSRYKRSVKHFADDKTDYVKYKKDRISDFEAQYENDVLKKSDLAGEVLAVSVTFYGTG